VAAVIRVDLIDDDRLLAEALETWTRHRDDLALASYSPTFADFSFQATGDVVVLDLRLQDGTDPVTNVGTLVAAGRRVLVVSTAREQEQVAATFEAGADGYLTKDAGLEALAHAVTEVAAGRSVYSRELVFAWLRDKRPGRPQLSQQEETVLMAYVSGLTLDAAARRAGVQPGTAKGYLDRAKAKYRALGRKADTKLDLADRVREDRRRD